MFPEFQVVHNRIDGNDYAAFGDALFQDPGGNFGALAGRCVVVFAPFLPDGRTPDVARLRAQDHTHFYGPAIPGIPGARNVPIEDWEREEAARAGANLAGATGGGDHAPPADPSPGPSPDASKG